MVRVLLAALALAVLVAMLAPRERFEDRAGVIGSLERMFGAANVVVARAGEPADTAKVVAVVEDGAVTSVQVPPQWSLTAPAWK